MEHFCPSIFVLPCSEGGIATNIELKDKLENALSRMRKVEPRVERFMPCRSALLTQ
jgi:hypothetical protein